MFVRHQESRAINVDRFESIGVEPVPKNVKGKGTHRLCAARVDGGNEVCYVLKYGTEEDCADAFEDVISELEDTQGVINIVPEKIEPAPVKNGLHEMAGDDSVRPAHAAIDEGHMHVPVNMELDERYRRAQMGLDPGAPGGDSTTTSLLESMHFAPAMTTDHLSALREEATRNNAAHDMDVKISAALNRRVYPCCDYDDNTPFCPKHGSYGHRLNALERAAVRAGREDTNAYRHAADRIRKLKEESTWKTCECGCVTTTGICPLHGKKKPYTTPTVEELTPEAAAGILNFVTVWNMGGMLADIYRKRHMDATDRLRKWSKEYQVKAPTRVDTFLSVPPGVQAGQSSASVGLWL